MDIPATDAQNTRREHFMLLLFAVAMLAFGAACWFAYPHVTPMTKQWLARRQLPELRQNLKDQNWQQAAAALREARRWAPDDTEVLHASLEFITSVGGDPRGTISLVRRLQETGAATPNDLVLLGKMHARLGETAKAREIFDQLPADIRQQKHGLDLQALLLDADGHAEEAMDIRRTALQSTTDDPSSMQQLAVMDLSSSDPARRRAMSERLWQIARSGGTTALMAIELLTRIKELTVPQVDELFQLVEAEPAADSRREAVRFTVISARMRLSPQLRTDLIDQELTHWKNRTPAQTAPLVNWLAAEREYARILRMVPAKVVARYTDLLPAYVDALRGTNKWQELDTLLSAGGIDAAYPPQKIRLWQVETQSHLHPDPSRARQILLRILEEAGRGDDPVTTLAAGNLAEKLNHWDLAAKCYEAVATKHLSARQSMLAKIYQMADYQHDGPAMLDACTRLLVSKPDSTSLLTQKLYLQLLLGIELELAQLQLQSVIRNTPAPSDNLQLLQALAAYREGQTHEVHAILRQIAQPEAFAPGERSVYAALLKLAGGDTGKAFRLVERISPALLLPEEKTFLQRAL